MANKPETLDAPTKNEHDQLKRYCAMLEAKMRRMDSRIKAMDERLRNMQSAVAKAADSARRASQRVEQY